MHVGRVVTAAEKLKVFCALPKVKNSYWHPP